MNNLNVNENSLLDGFVKVYRSSSTSFAALLEADVAKRSDYSQN